MASGVCPITMRKAEIFLIAFIIVIFILSAGQSGFFAFQQIDKSGDYTFILSSIISMAVSGIGLVLILALKLLALERSDCERQKTATLLSSRVAAMEAAGDGIGIVDSEGNFSYINKSLRRLHGLEESDLRDYIGKPWLNLYSEKGQQDIQQHVIPVLMQAGYWKGDSPIVRKDGTLVHAEMSLTKLDDGGFIGTARDITDRIETEKEKSELRDQLFQAQKMEAIGRLAGGIAHDFNNILASMMGYNEFLLEDIPDGTREHHFASQIMSGNIQAQQLVEQILTFSRRSDASKEVIDLVDVVNESALMLKSTVPAGINVQIAVYAGEALIEANRTQISQILMNLCVNAMDAIADGKGKISLNIDVVDSEQAVRREMLADIVCYNENPPPVNIESQGDRSVFLELGVLERQRSYICLNVSDTGQGMSKEVMEHIFEPFYTTKPVDQGTGLGLSSVHGIVVAHGGAVTVSSIEGQGTIFSLYFPLAEEQQEADYVTSNNVNYNGSGRVLLVEDEEAVRDMMVQMLGRIGYKVDSCVDGGEAIDYLRENPGCCDLVISDYNMPQMNGAEMAHEIALDFPDLPVIIVSGYSNRKLKNIASENPCIKAILRKPVKREVLSKQIHELIGQGQKAA